MDTPQDAPAPATGGFGQKSQFGYAPPPEASQEEQAAATPAEKPATPVEGAN